MLLGSVCLTLVMVVMACAGPTPTPGPSPTAEVFNVKLSATYGAGEAYRIENLVENIEAMSNGQVDVDLHLGSGIVPYGEELTGVGEGLVDMAQGIGVAYMDLIPVAAVETGFAFLYQMDGGVEPHILFYDYGLLDIVRDAYAEHGVYYISPLVLDPMDAIGNKEVHSLADLKKAKVRASGITAEILAKAGVPTTYVPWSELYTSLATGIVDIAISVGAQAYLDYQFDEVCDYFIRPSLTSCFCNNFLYNLERWESLPPHIQTIIEVACRENSYWNSQNFAKGELEAINKMRELGMKVIHLDAEAVNELSAGAAEFMDEYAATDARSAQALEIVKQWWKLQGRFD